MHDIRSDYEDIDETLQGEARTDEQMAVDEETPQVEQTSAEEQTHDGVPLTAER